MKPQPAERFDEPDAAPRALPAVDAPVRPGLTLIAKRDRHSTISDPGDVGLPERLPVAIRRRARGEGRHVVAGRAVNWSNSCPHRDPPDDHSCPRHPAVGRPVPIVYPLVIALTAMVIVAVTTRMPAASSPAWDTQNGWVRPGGCHAVRSRRPSSATPVPKLKAWRRRRQGVAAARPRQPLRRHLSLPSPIRIN